jgi:soluble lytic murein transglycosylase-like protein
MLYANENAYDALIQPTAATYGVPVALVKAIIGVESNFIANAMNLTGRDLTRGGSYGLMQMSLQTAQGYGFTGSPTDLLDPQTNLTYGCQFLRDVYNQAGQDPATAASLYNGGKSVGPSAFSNQSYVNNVMSNYSYFSGGSSSDDAGSGGAMGSLAVVFLLIAVGWGVGKWAGAW